MKDHITDAEAAEILKELQATLQVVKEAEAIVQEEVSGEAEL